jgi:mRNA-decapping enzyme 1B
VPRVVGASQPRALTTAAWRAENLVQDVLGDFEFELSPPYLLYRTGNEVRAATGRSCALLPPAAASRTRRARPAQVNGLWFYQQEECDQMTVLLNRCAPGHACCCG